MHQYTKEDIQSTTALTIDFINHASSKLADLLQPYRIRSERGKLLYNEAGLRIWDVIKQRKERGENIRQIREAVATIVSPDSQTDNTASKPLPSDSQTTPDNREYLRFVVDTIRDAFVIAMKEKDDRILLLEEGREARIQKGIETQKEIVDLKIELQLEKSDRDRKATQRFGLVRDLENLPLFGRGKRQREILEKIRRIDSDAQDDPVRPQDGNTLESGTE